MPIRARDLGLACGFLPPGERNTIADVPGVTVGHTTLTDGAIRTGVTASSPALRNVLASAWHGAARSGATAAATSHSPSRQPTTCPTTPPTT